MPGVPPVRVKPPAGACLVAAPGAVPAAAHVPTPLRQGCAIAPAKPTAAHQPQEPLKNLVEGTLVEYYSATNGCWIPTLITQVDAETGAVVLDLKPNVFFDLNDQRQKLRPRKVPSQAHLDWVRAVLREEGHLEREALAMFGRVAAQCKRSTSMNAAGGLVLMTDDMDALASEVDAKLGVAGSVMALRQRCARNSNSSNGVGRLTFESFVEAMWDFLWGIQREFGHAMPRVKGTSSVRQSPLTADYDFVGGASSEPLGKGTYGVVRLAKERCSGALRAVKIVKRTEHTFGNGEQLDTELEHLRQCDHPHIVKLYAHYRDRENVYLVMDYCSGGELQAIIYDQAKAKRRIPDDFTSAVTRQVLLAIAHVHARGILHLDLKSANIMLLPSTATLPPGKPDTDESIYEGYLLDKHPHAMVIDLGVAQIFRPGNFRNNRPIGTPSTMAPEVWRGDFTPKADVFSCGVVLFEMLSLTLPFGCGADYNLAIQYWSASPAPPLKRIAKAPEAAVELCRRMLLLDRHQRPTVADCLRCRFVCLSDPSKPKVEILEGIASTSKRSVLHKSVALAIARAWPSNRLPTIKRLFEEIDTNRTGRLDKAQVRAALERLGMEKRAAAEAADSMDLSRDGTVDWTEFVAACVHLSSDAFDEAIEQIFKQADSDGDGLLSQEDLSTLLGAEHLSGGAVSDIFTDLIGRTDKGARIDWPTFRRHFRLLGAERGTACGSGPADSSWMSALGATLGFFPQPRGSGGAAAGAGLGLSTDLLTEAMEWLEQAKDAFWPHGDPGEPSEEVLQRLAEMGFRNREKCIAVLKRYRNNLRPGLIDELLQSGAAEVKAP